MLALQAELEDLCFAVLQPTEYTLLRNELNSIWGLQQVIDLIPTQADSLFRQAQASIKLASQTADLSTSSVPHLPPAGTVPRPDVIPKPADADPLQKSVSGAADRGQNLNTGSQEGRQSMRSVAGDLYAHPKHGVTRSPSHMTLNIRQQKALESGLLKLTEAEQKGSSPTAVLNKPAGLPVGSAAPSSRKRKSHDSSPSSESFRSTNTGTSPSAMAGLGSTVPKQVHRSSSESETSSSSSSSTSTSPSSSTASASGAPSSSSSSNKESVAAVRAPRGVWFGLGSRANKADQVRDWLIAV